MAHPGAAATEAALVETHCGDGPYAAFLSLPKSGMMVGLGCCSLFQSDLMDGMDAVSDIVARAEGACNDAWSILRDCERLASAQEASDAGRRTRLRQVARIRAGKVGEEDWEAATQHVCAVTGIPSDVACQFLCKSSWSIDAALAAIAAAQVSGRSLCLGGEVVLYFKIPHGQATTRRFLLQQSAFLVYAEVASLLNQRRGKLVSRVCGAGLEISLGVETFGRTLRSLGLRDGQRYDVEVELRSSLPDYYDTAEVQEPELVGLCSGATSRTDELEAISSP